MFSILCVCLLLHERTGTDLVDVQHLGREEHPNLVDGRLHPVHQRDAGVPHLSN